MTKWLDFVSDLIFLRILCYPKLFTVKDKPKVLRLVVFAW